MEKVINDFSIPLTIWQCLFIIFWVFIIYALVRYFTMRKKGLKD